MRFNKMFLLVPLLMMIGAGCESGENDVALDEGDDLALVAKEEIVVKIENDLFNPPQMTVPIGSRVLWLNSSKITHTVTSGIEPAIVVDSGPIEPGETFEFTFNDTTAFEYYSRNAQNTARGIILVLPEEEIDEDTTDEVVVTPE